MDLCHHMVTLDCNCIIRISPHLSGYLSAKPKDQSLDNSVIRDNNLKISGLYLCVCFYSLKKCPWTKSSLMMERRKEWSASRNEIERKKESEVAQSCPTLCDTMDCSLPDFSVHGIFQARILEWIAISFIRGSFQPRDRTQVSCIAGRCFTIWATREAQEWDNYVWSYLL